MRWYYLLLVVIVLCGCESQSILMIDSAGVVKTGGGVNQSYALWTDSNTLGSGAISQNGVWTQISNGVIIDGDLMIVNKTYTSGDFTPAFNNTFDIGNSTNMWRTGRFTTSVGIGTDNPGAPLHVVSSGTNPAVLIASDDDAIIQLDTGNSNDWYIWNDEGNGNDLKFDRAGMTGSAMLHLRNNGAVRIPASLRVGANTDPANVLSVTGIADFTTPSGTTVTITDLTSTNSLISSSGNLYLGGGSGGGVAFRVNGATTAGYIDSSSRMSIGSTSPNTALEIVGTSSRNGVISQTDADVVINFTGISFSPATTINTWSYLGMASSTAGGLQVNGFEDTGGITPLILAGHLGSNGTTTANAVSLSGWKWDGSNSRTALTNNESVFAVRTGTTELVKFLANGNTGIGTSLPLALLHINSSGTTVAEDDDLLISGAIQAVNAKRCISWMSSNTSVRTGKICVGADASGNQGEMVFYTATTANTVEAEAMRITNDKKVGIGTTNPNLKLAITSSSADDGIQIGVVGATGLNRPQINFYKENTGTNWSIVGGGVTNNFYIKPSTGATGSTTDANAYLTITTTGNVGIGNSSPTKKLEVYTTTDKDGVLISGTQTGAIGLFVNNSNNHAYSFKASGGSAGTPNNLLIKDETTNVNLLAFNNSGTATFYGDVIFNNFYGEMWLVNETGFTITLTTPDVYVNITNQSDGYVNGMNLISNYYLNITQSGKYKVDYSISFSSAGANQLYGVTVGLNGVPQQNRCYAHRTISASGSVGNVGSSCILNLTAGDRITLMIADEATPTANANVYMSGLAMIRVGS